MENFVRDYGTGNAIPDPPPFIDYASPDAQPASSQRPTAHPSTYVRQTQRSRQVPPAAQNQPPEPEEEPVNYTGVGAGGRDSQLQRSQTQSRASTRAQDLAQPQPQPNGAITNGRVTPNVGTRPPDPQADPIDPTAKTMLRVGPNAYEVNLDRDPQAHAGRPGSSASSMAPRVGQDDDPLAQQMNQLRNAAGGGSMRRSGQWGPPAQQSPPAGATSRRDPGGKLSPPPGGAPPNRDYRNSAEIVVGAYPAQAATSRPTSPNPPTNVFMKPPSQNSASPSAGVSVQNVLADYQQSLPGERKSISRSNSRSNSISIPAPQASSRPMSSSSGHAGIGAQGRSTSPQPFQPLSRSASPALQGPPGGAGNRNSYSRPPANGPPAGHGHGHSGSTTRQGSISIPQQPAHQQRPTSPSIGIQLDPTGRVVADDMATMYGRPPQQAAPPQQPPVQQYGAPPPAAQQIQRRPSYNAGPNGAPYVPPPQQQYGPGSAPMYNAPPPQQQQQPQYAPPQQQPVYGAPPQQQYPQQGRPSQMYQPPAAQGYGQQAPAGALVQRGPSVNGGYYPPQQAQQPQQYRAPSPRAPSPQPPAQPNQPPPTGQYTDDGRGVLFYGTFDLLVLSVPCCSHSPPISVKAMYNYRATIDEEFDFQEGDIIAVTATPEDGWWSGELLDETRRQPGRHIFPSNFVCLF